MVVIHDWTSSLDLLGHCKLVHGLEVGDRACLARAAFMLLPDHGHCGRWQQHAMCQLCRAVRCGGGVMQTCTHPL